MHDSAQYTRSPFKFLDAYGKEDGKIFFGRENEVEELYQYVNKNRLVLVYGQSGTGKTSVVKCGLANRFDVTDWLPFFIRRGKNINTSLLQTLGQSKALGSKLLTANNLLSSLKLISSRYVRPIYLIFDQFEELLILGDEAEKNQLIVTIQQILKSENTQAVNLLFILREEYFAWLDLFERHIPSFSERRLRIEPMRPRRLQEVIINSCAAFNVSLEDPKTNAQQIIASLRSKGGIPLPYLQVFFDILWREEFARTYPNGLSGTSLPALTYSHQQITQFSAIQDILDRFLTERIDTIQQRLNSMFTNVDPDLVRKVLGDFATDEGTKRAVNYHREENQIYLEENAPRYLHQIPHEVRTACLNAFEDSRLLRVDEETIELAHDTLAILIDQRRTDEERQLNDARSQIRSSYRIHLRTGEFLSSRQLALYEHLIPELGLEDHLFQFVMASQKIRKAENQRLIEEERKKGRRAKLLAIAFFLLAISALAGLAFAINATIEARMAKEKVEQTNRELQIAQKRVKSQRDSVEVALKKFEEEEATRVLNYVSEIELRAKKLKQRHYSVYLDMLKELEIELSKYQSNSKLRNKHKKIKSIIEASQKK